MKTTIDIPDPLYRELKARSALEGVTVREVAVSLFEHWVQGRPSADIPEAKKELPVWYGSLRKYAKNAKGRHDMEAVRESVARARAKAKQK